MHRVQPAQKEVEGHAESGAGGTSRQAAHCGRGTADSSRPEPVGNPEPQARKAKARAPQRHARRRLMRRGGTQGRHVSCACIRYTDVENDSHSRAGG